MNTYLLCGLKVESELSFPELQPWRGDPSRPADLEFSLGRVAELIAPDHVGGRFQTKGDAIYVLERDWYGRLMVADGRRIVVQANEGVDAAQIRMSIIGTVQSVLWHQRGLLPLHASALKIGPRAVVIAGQRGSGKSVLAAALAQRGQALISDDFAIIDQSGDQPMVLPGYQRVRLWEDACAALSLENQTVAKAHPAGAKYVMQPPATLTEDAAQVTDILIMDGPRGRAFSLGSMSAVDVVKGLLSVVHTPEVAQALGRQSQILHGVNGLISEKVRIQRLTIPDNLNEVGQTADAIIAAMQN